jgi:hypothetical protein
LYGRAKTTYSSHFRDITSGSNYVNPATADYDLVTGLGSPLTTNFGTEFTISPTSGPSAGAITLNGVGFTAGSSVNISYLNPVTHTWIPIINNLTTAFPEFTYSTNAPDLLRNNTAGDNQPLSDSIVFRAQDNSNGHAYNTTVPYTEWRRGIAQVGNSTAQGLYGNNTNLALSVFVQNGDSVPVCGEWFSPGVIHLLWDGITDLGTIATDETGLFNTTIQVPTTTAGQHSLVIRDNSTDFCLNLTRLPTLANDYVDSWQTSNFTINLSPDYAMNETFYRINNGSIYNVTSNGQPTITTEGSNNTLEYWSTWNVYGTSTMELSHWTLTGIKLDKTAPTGSITTSSSIVDTPEVTLSLNANDDVSGVAQMRFASENGNWSSWEPYATSKTWTLQDGDGVKTVSVQYIDNAGLISSTYSCTVTLQTPQPSPSPLASSDPTPTPTPTTTPTQTPSPSPSPSNSPTTQPSATPQVPELNIQIVLILLAASTLTLTVLFKRKENKK